MIAVDALSARTVSVQAEINDLRLALQAENDAHLAEILGLQRSSISQWKKRGRVPEKVKARAAAKLNAGGIALPQRAARRTASLSRPCPDATIADVRKVIALLSKAERRVLTLELMVELLGG